MKLTTKIFWIPAGIQVSIYLVLGFTLFMISVANSKRTIDVDLEKLIKSELSHLSFGLDFVASSQNASDAFFGLEVEDSAIADDLLLKLEALGLDDVIFADLEGKVIYPGDRLLPSGLGAAFKYTGMERGQVRIQYADQSMVGYAPVFDVETPKGFLLFVVKIPDSLATVAEREIWSSPG
jgi:hypothetical protein